MHVSKWCLLVFVAVTVNLALGQKSPDGDWEVVGPPLGRDADHPILWGAGTGQAFMGWSTDHQDMYALGFLNAVAIVPFVGGTGKRFTWFHDCILVGGMTNHQIGEMLRQYIKSRPLEWHQPLSLLTYQAMENSCPNSPLRGEKRPEQSSSKEDWEVVPPPAAVQPSPKGGGGR